MRKTFAQRAIRPVQVSALQVRRAYLQHFGQPMPGNETYQWACSELVKALGIKQAETFIGSQSNDPTIAD